MAEGYLKIIVLKELDASDLTGYELMKKISDSIHKKPSAGSMYPLLAELKKKDLVNVKEDGRKKIYSLTKKGKIRISQLLEQKKALIKNHIHSFKIIEDLTEEEKQSKDLNALIQKLNSKTEVIPYNIDLLSELKNEIISIALNHDCKEKKLQLREILKTTIKKLRKLNR